MKILGAARSTFDVAPDEDLAGFQQLASFAIRSFVDHLSPSLLDHLEESRGRLISIRAQVVLREKDASEISPLVPAVEPTTYGGRPVTPESLAKLAAQLREVGKENVFTDKMAGLLEACATEISALRAESRHLREILACTGGA